PLAEAPASGHVMDRRRMDLIQRQQVRRRDTHDRRHRSPILQHRLAIVLRTDPAIEASVNAGRSAPMAAEESVGDIVPPREFIGPPEAHEPNPAGTGSARPVSAIALNRVPMASGAASRVTAVASASA